MTRSSRWFVQSLFLLGLVTPSTLMAGPNGNAKVLLHQQRVDKGIFCGPTSRVHPLCPNVDTSAELYPVIQNYVFLLVTDGDATAGLQSVHFGISYDNSPQQGVEIYGAFFCGQGVTAAGVNGPWPASRSGNTITWSTCETVEPGGAGTGVTATVCGFYMSSYGPDNLTVSPHPSDGLVSVTSCSNDVDVIAGDGLVRVPSPLGYIRFSTSGTEPGYSPCGELVIPVEGTTWGRVKALIAR